jgi:HAD superfamily phosphatase (TIGR01668 family)
VSARPPRRRGLGRWLLPDERVDHVSDLTPEFLEARDLRGLVLDIDNTLVPYGVRDDVPGLQEWVESLREAGIPARLVSNAMPDRVRFWAERLGLPGVGMLRGSAAKPFPMGFRRAFRAMGLGAHHVAVVGDQLFTDVLGGNLAGGYTILVTPLSTNALPHTQLTRRLERFVLERLAPTAGRTAGDHAPSSRR